MILFMGKSRKITLFISFLLLSTFLYSQNVPQELDAARDEIQRAVDLGAENNAADDLKEARGFLDEADKKFTDGDSENAVVSAVSAKEAAVRAGMTSAPVHVKELRASAEKAIKNMEVRGADASDVESAKKSFSDGDSFLKKAEAAGEDKASALEAYLQAKEKFSESFNTADAAIVHSTMTTMPEDSGKTADAASRSDDALSLKASEIEARIEKAREYGASESAAEELNAAETAFDEANAALDSGNADDASLKLNMAEEKADAVLEKAMSQFAAKKKDEAESQVSSAISSYERGAVKNATLQDYLNAAGEALQSAKDRYAEQQYEESIKDSEEALNLAKVLNEQVSGDDAAKDTASSSVPYGGGPGSGSSKKADAGKASGTSSSGWKEYTVQNKNPSDCLWRIAEYDIHYGHGRYWKKIYEANKSRIKNPNIIRPGMVLKIPAIPGTTGFPADRSTSGEDMKKENPAVKEDPGVLEQESPSSKEDEDKASADEHSPREEEKVVPAEEGNPAPDDNGGAAPEEEKKSVPSDNNESTSSDDNKNALPADESNPVKEDDGASEEKDKTP